MSTATPTRETVTRSLRSFLNRLTDAGWEVEAPGVRAPPSVAYCLIARPPRPDGATRSRSHLVYVYEGAREIEVEELWRLVSDTRLAGADHAVMCLDRQVVLSESARTTAGLLQVRVLRMQE